jgi:hypothetical protein
MIVLLRFGNLDVKPRMVRMNSILMTFKAAGVFEPAVALRTGDHG